MKTVLVTGCSGYIGSHLCAYLKNEGYEVWGIDNTSPSEKLEPYIDEYRYLNILNKKDWQAGSWHEKEFDAVIHLAALVQVGESVMDPIGYYETNIQGTINVMRYTNYKNFIFASTGAASQVPYSPYSLSKFAAEHCVRQFMTQPSPFNDGYPYTIFRFYNVIGTFGFEPTNPDGLFYNLMRAKETGSFNLYGVDYDTKDGSAVRDYISIYDICYAIELAIRKPSCVPGSDIQPYAENLCHGTGYTVKEIIKTFTEVNNCHMNVVYMPRREGDLPKSYLTEPSPYVKIPYTSLEEMLKVK